jgi:hypothetical protein
VERLRHRDLDGVLRAVGEIAALDEAGDGAFPVSVLESLRVLIGSDTAEYSELDRVGKKVLAGTIVGDEGENPGGEVF